MAKYIRAGATGANNGSSWADAWTSLASVTWNRTETFYIAGGTYTGGLTINVTLSGTDRVNLKKANASDNSGDAGWSSSYASTVAQINGQVDLDKGYVTIDGVTGSGKSGHGIKLYNSAASDVVTLENVNSLELIHCEIQGAGSVGATAYSGVGWNNIAGAKKGTRIAYCWIHEVSTNGIKVLGAVGTSYSDYGLLFENNVISETGRCTDLDQHGQGMQLGLASDMKYIIIRGNVYNNIVGSGMIVWLGGSGGSTSSDHRYIRIYNNLFWIDDANYNVISPGVMWAEAERNGNTGVYLRDCLFANNTIYGLLASGGNNPNIVIESPHSNILVENNIWEGCNFSANHSGIDTQSNNGYYGNTGAAVPSGTTNQVNGASSTFTDGANDIFTLVDGGYAVGSGIDLSATFTDDFAGATRPIPFDIGAYAYGSGGGTVSTPTFDPTAGSYVGTQSVTIATATDGASIRYTIDGSTPSDTVGTVYSGAISISSSCTLKAIAYKSGMNNSSVASAAYTINESPPASTVTFTSLTATNLVFS